MQQPAWKPEAARLPSGSLPALTLVVLLLVFLFPCAPAYGQAPENEENRTPAAMTDRSTPPAAGGIEREEPEIFYLPDENGKLLHVPDLNLELYQRLYNQYRGLTAPDPPRYVLQQLDVTGEVGGDHAVLTVEYQIQTTEQAKPDTWIRVPLRFDDCVLRGPGKYVGAGQHFLEYRADGDGYVFWLRTEKETDHRVTLTLAAPLRTASDTTTLRFVARDVPTHLQLEVPRTRIEAEVTRQSVNILRPPQERGEATSLVLDGLGGEVELSWRPAPVQPMVAAPRLDAAGEIRVTVGGIGQLSCEAQLRLRGFGGSVDAFRVRLPPRMHLLPLEQPGYRVLVVPRTEDVEDPSGDPSGEPAGQLVEVRLNSPTTSEVNVRLLYERIPDQRGDASPTDPPEAGWQEVGALDVQGAIRQRGHFDFVVEGEYALDWEAAEGVSRRDDIPEAARQQNVVARFEYFRQPCSLKVQIRRKQKRILVEPTYELTVGGGRIRLDAAFRYRVRGDAAFRLRTDFSQWIVDSVERGGVATAENVNIAQVAPLEVPVIVDSTELAEGFVIRVQAHRDYSADAKQLTIPMPRPLRTEPQPASIIVKSAENVELTFKDLSRQGLVIDSRESSDGPVHRFRERSAEAVASVIAGLRVLPRLVSVGGNHVIELQSSSAMVQQNLEYRINYEPLTRLWLRVDPQLLPADGRNPSGFSVRLDGKELPFHVVPVETDVEGANAATGSQAPPSTGTSGDISDAPDPALSGRNIPQAAESQSRSAPPPVPGEGPPMENEKNEKNEGQDEDSGDPELPEKQPADGERREAQAVEPSRSPNRPAESPAGPAQPRAASGRAEGPGAGAAAGVTDVERQRTVTEAEDGRQAAAGERAGEAESPSGPRSSSTAGGAPVPAADPADPADTLSAERRGLQFSEEEPSGTEAQAVASEAVSRGGRSEPTEAAGARDVPRAMIEVVLPEPLLGRFPIEVSFRVAQAEEAEQGGSNEGDRAEEQSLRIPLVVPAANDVTRWEPSRLMVRYPGSMDLTVPGDGWHPPATAEEPAGGNGLLQLEGSTSQPELRLQVRLSRRSLPTELRVERAWLQAVMTQHRRLDRFSFRVADAGSTVQVELPTGARSTDLRVSVDRQPQPLVLLDNSQRVTIPLPDTSPEDGHVVELWYWFDARPEANQTFVIDAPRIQGAERVDRMYWQVIVPRHEHLIAPPRNATAEQTWTWNGFYWGRQANLSQRELEAWLGGLQHNPPPGATNRYLFVSLGDTAPLRMFVASRLVLILLASGLALGVGLVVIYYPALQHPAMYLLLAVGLAILAFWTPEVALVLAQAAGLGLLLFLLSRLIHWALSGRRRTATSLRGLSGPDSKSAEVPLAKPESGASTASVGLAYQLPETDAR